MLTSSASAARAAEGDVLPAIAVEGVLRLLHARREGAARQEGEEPAGKLLSGCGDI